jgi:protein involved in polysaccharide export with SLBB domain
MPQTKFYSLKNEGDTRLSPYDEVEVYDYYAKHILEPVSISGEVVKPTQAFYEDGMTLKRLLDMAGGFNKKAYLKKVEIVRYYIDKDENRKRKILQVDLTSKKIKDIMLKPYDEVTVFKIPNWGDRRVVVLKGEVRFPGVYNISKGEKLSSVLKRAGGFTDEAFIEGAVFTRESVRKNQIEQYNAALAKIKRQLAIYNAMPANAKQSAAMAQSSGALNEVIMEAKKYQPIGRVSISLDRNISKIQESEYNLVLKDKDTITIPTKIDTVTVFGEVFNPTSFVYNSSYNIDDYIKLASGLGRAADASNIYVIHADGRSEPASSGWFGTSANIQKGDTIVVPMYIKEYNTLEVWNSVAKVLSSFAVTAAALDTLGVIK